MLSPTEIVEGVLGRKTHLAPQPICVQSVQSGTFIDFIEVRQCFTLEERLVIAAVFHRRTVRVVEQAFNQIACRRKVFQSLLILNANRRAAKFIGDAHRSNVHFALLQGLRFGQLRLLVRPPIEGHALLDQPGQNRARLLLKASHAFRIFEQMIGKELERNLSAVASVSREINFAHSARADR